MSRSYRSLVSGVVALVVGLVGGVALTGAAAAPVTSTVALFKSMQCPPGYILNPQNTQQCVPWNNPYGGTSVPPGSH
jgi:hypothetical protein